MAALFYEVPTTPQSVVRFGVLLRQRRCCRHVTALNYYRRGVNGLRPLRAVTATDMAY